MKTPIDMNECAIKYGHVKDFQCMGGCLNEMALNPVACKSC